MNSLLMDNHLEQDGDYAVYDGKNWIDLRALSREPDMGADDEKIRKTVRTFTRVIIAALFIPICIGSIIGKDYIVLIASIVIFFWLRNKLSEQWETRLAEKAKKRQKKSLDNIFQGSVLEAGYRKQIIKDEDGNDILKSFGVLMCGIEDYQETIHFELNENTPESIRKCFDGLLPEDREATAEVPALIGREILFQKKMGQYKAKFIELGPEDRKNVVPETEDQAEKEIPVPQIADGQKEEDKT